MKPLNLHLFEINHFRLE